MAIISRRQYDHPALATAGGSALHASISNLYTVLGDDSMSRYKAFTAVANSSVGVIAHEFGLDFANLKVQIFTGTYPALTLVSDPIGTGWTVAATSGLASRSIDVTAPASGGPHTYAVLVSHESNATNFIPGLVSIGAQSFAGAKNFLSPILSSLGTAALPGYSFTGDPNTGMWSSAADTLSFSTAGVKVAEASSTGAWTLGVAGVANRINGGFGVDRAAAANIKVDIQKNSTTTTFSASDITLRVINDQSSDANQYTGIAFGNFAWTGAIYTIQEATVAARMMKFHHSDATGGTVGTVNGAASWVQGSLTDTGGLTVNASGGQPLTLASASSTNRIVLKYSSTTIGGYMGVSATGLDFLNSASDYTFRVSDAGACTLGASGSVATTQHIINGSMKFTTGGAFNTGDHIRFNANTMHIHSGSTELRFVSYDNATVGGVMSNAGAWTLGPASSVNQNLIVNGTMVVNHNSTDGSPAISSFGTTTTSLTRVYLGGSGAGSSIQFLAYGQTADDAVKKLEIGSNSLIFGTFYATAQLGMAANSASAPGYSWVGDLDTGMYRAGTNSIGFSTNGTNVGTISSTGAWTLGPAAGLSTGAAAYHTVYGSTVGILNSGSNRACFTGPLEAAYGANFYRDGAATAKAVGAGGASYIEIVGTTTPSTVAFYFETTTTSQTANTAHTNVIQIATATAAGAWTLGASTSGFHTLQGAQAADYQVKITNTAANGSGLRIQCDNTNSTCQSWFSSATNIGNVTTAGAWTWGAATNAPYQTYHTTNKNIFSAPTAATSSSGGFFIGANAYSSAGAQPTRQSGTGGWQIVLDNSTSDTVATFSLQSNLAADGATTAASDKFSITQAGACMLGMTLGATAPSFPFKPFIIQTPASTTAIGFTKFHKISTGTSAVDLVTITSASWDSGHNLVIYVEAFNISTGTYSIVKGIATSNGATASNAINVAATDINNNGLGLGSFAWSAGTGAATLRYTPPTNTDDTVYEITINNRKFPFTLP